MIAGEAVGKLSNKKLAFVLEYLQCFNATEAARRVGYKHPNTQGPRLLLNVGIKEAIREILTEKAMPAEEVLYRLSAMACANMSEFIKPTGGIDWDAVHAKGFLVKKVKHQPGMNSEIELYDAQSALVQLGKHYQLFVERVEHSGTIQTEDVNGLTPDQKLRAITSLIEAVASRGSANGADKPDMAATEHPAMVGPTE